MVEIGERVADFVLAEKVDEGSGLFAYNVWQDNLPEIFARDRAKVLEAMGEGARMHSVVCVSGYEGEVLFSSGAVKKKLFFSLAPVQPPRVQSIGWSEVDVK